MKNTYESQLFIKELSRLFFDYKHCKDRYIKEQISDDIDLLKSALNVLL